MTRDPRPTTPARADARPLADDRNMLVDDWGTTAIEYALLASLVAILAIGGLQALSSSTGGLYGTLEAISLAIQDALGR